MAKRPLRLHADDGARALHYALDRRENVLLPRERNFQIQLRELELAIRAEILVAEASANLKIAVHAGNHQYLLENLRGLRQRVELSVMDAAGDEAVPRTFGRRAREDRSFDLKKAELVERFANREKNPVAQLDIGVRARSPQVEIAVAQTRLFARGHVVFDRERRRLRVIQNVKSCGNHFHVAGGNFRIRFLAADDAAFHGHHEFRAQILGLRVRFGIVLLVKNNLRDSRAVPQIDENQLTDRK